MLKIKSLTLGPVQTNTYILADTESNEAIVVDPSWDGAEIAKAAEKEGWHIKEIWLTHAHFDHIGGIAELVKSLPETPPIYLHTDDYDLWKDGGGAKRFGFSIDPGPKPEALTHGQFLRVGNFTFEARHTPGHRPGHCVFFCADTGILFSGDLIFYRSVGRTDLPGGNWATLEKSIREQIYTLPNNIRIFSGHGDETSVGDEKENNHFIKG
ncbi:MAG: MBL fold metallo-hydrolase [Anaerolineae bacterium]|jgi:glyoxylase-like metal-dependent hydrolase (beta-lactamase superfamily II)|nr:MBL fold metallo-hydrolase [Anaerolineae bacterium]MBT3712491.1 MBL fold metallo-hydrolase [Anaerolineae bacterium]MBT4312354.1 MBL fold metallo-hydrolase [Anaerolineae bacterium]MBT4457332.1 MBL fold metallo-hydrolase [Anaerolineae bacterium]MBT4842875.1 MBL fold metallo-hydrolase [Anaerolineae bacterium]